MAETGATFRGFEPRTSINDNGVVGFVGQHELSSTSFESIYRGDASSPPTILSPGFSGSTRDFSGFIQINNAGEVVARDRVSGAPILTFIRKWNGGFTTVARSGTTPNNFDSVSQPNINNAGEVSYLGLKSSPSAAELRLNSGGTDTLLASYTGLFSPRQMLTDLGELVYRDPNNRIVVWDRTGTIATVIASSAVGGFASPGDSPGASDDGAIVAFAGDRGQGPGIFVSVAEPLGARTIIRLAGENTGAGGPFPDLGRDANGNPLFFSSFDINSRVAVIRNRRGATGLLDDNIVVCFVGTPNSDSSTLDPNWPEPLVFTQQPGIWTVRLDVRMVNEAVAYFPTNIMPVIQNGDTLTTLSGPKVVSSFAVHDPLASVQPPTQTTSEVDLGSHRVGFWASTGTEQFIVKASPCACAEKQAIALPPSRTVTAHDWTFTYEVSADDGLVLTDVKLAHRYMAKQMSVPYYQLDAAGVSNRFELKPSGSDATARSRLIAFREGTLADRPHQPYSVAATYYIDRIGQSCLKVVQEYLFYPLIAGDRLEPSGFLKAQRFVPMVRYAFCGHDGETLNSFSAAQRLHFQADGVASNNSALFRDGVGVTPSFPWIDLGTVAYRDENPLATEGHVTGVLNGQPGDWDNLHQTWNTQIDEPFFDTGTPAGCPECVHVHWGWLNLFVLGAPFDGIPIVPKKARGYGYDSNQSVDVALVKFAADELDPQAYATLVNGEPLAGNDQVFWYAANSTLVSDEFFIHGGFFAPQMRIRVWLDGSELIILGPPGRTYTVESKTLGDPGWIAGETIVTTGPITRVPIVRSTSGVKFFRLRSPTSP